MDTVAKLQEDNTKLLTVIQQLAGSGYTHRPSQAHGSTPKWDPKGYCHTHGYRITIGHNSKTCQYKNIGIKMKQRDKTQWVVTKKTKLGNQKADGALQQVTESKQTIK